MRLHRKTLTYLLTLDHCSLSQRSSSSVYSTILSRGSVSVAVSSWTRTTEDGPPRVHSWTDKDNRLTISSPRYYSTEQWDINDSGLIGLFFSKSELQISFTFVAFLADIYRCSGRPSIPASHSSIDAFSALVSTPLAPRFHWKNAARDFPGPGGKACSQHMQYIVVRVAPPANTLNRPVPRRRCCRSLPLL